MVNCKKCRIDTYICVYFQYVFGSFLSRDSTYRFVVSAWKKSQELVSVNYNSYIEGLMVYGSLVSKILHM